MSALSHFTSVTTMTSHRDQDSSSDDDALSSIHTYSTASTNATLDNQPGAGETLESGLRLSTSWEEAGRWD